MFKIIPASENRWMVLKVSLVMLMIILICCLAAYIVYANAEDRSESPDPRVLDQAGIVLAVLLGIAAVLLLVVNGWFRKQPVIDPVSLGREFAQWQRELQGMAALLQAMQKENTEDCLYQMGMISEKLSDLSAEFEVAIQQLPAQK